MATNLFEDDARVAFLLRLISKSIFKDIKALKIIMFLKMYCPARVNTNSPLPKISSGNKNSGLKVKII